jgi:outer membrane protein assembly factor BamB
MRMTTLALAAALLCSPAVGLCADWPQWHGPKRDNISTETGLLKTWPAGGPMLLWTAKGLGHGFSSIAVVNGTIYTTGTIGKQTYVLALDLDGKPKWKSPNGMPWDPGERRRWARRYAGARGTPTVDGGVVYHLNELGRLAAFDAAKGGELWAVDLTKQFDAAPPKWGYSESVLIDGDRLICAPAGKKGHIVALDKKTGKTVWTNTTHVDEAAYSSAFIAQAAGVRQIIKTSENWMFGVRASDGELLWRYPQKNRRSNNIPDPIYHDGHVFGTTGYGGGSALVRLTANGEKKVGVAKVWTSDVLDNCHGGVLLIDGYVYGTGHVKKGWACLEFKTGRVMWRTSDGAGAVTYAGGLIYFVGEKGKVSLVKPSPKSLQTVSSFQAPSGGSGLHWPHPVVCGGRLYVRHSDKLFAYDIKAK